jgi:hypothetical protein
MPANSLPLPGPSRPKHICQFFIPACHSIGTPLSSSALSQRNLALPTLVCLVYIMTSTGTFRGTPGRGQGRGAMPTFSNSPSTSSIPRPAIESHSSSTPQSDAGGSTMSASRQKQSKRDEVCLKCLISYYDCPREVSLTISRPSAARLRQI